MSSRRNNKMKIQIVFAPLPEEESEVERSAAKEFALRTAEHFRDETETGAATTICDVEISHLAEWKKDQLISPITPPSSSSNDECDDDDDITIVVVFLIACGPDGSVHRSVRKTTKWIKEQQENNKKKSKSEENNNNTTTTTTCMVALLGHSVCKTSAEQMEDEVFSPGRRLAKTLQKFLTTTAPQQSSSSSLSAVPTTATNHPAFLLETQVELEPPEDKFDGWVQSWVEMLRK
jgi:hypothetical protein